MLRTETSRRTSHEILYDTILLYSAVCIILCAFIRSECCMHPIYQRFEKCLCLTRIFIQLLKAFFILAQYHSPSCLKITLGKIVPESLAILVTESTNRVLEKKTFHLFRPIPLNAVSICNFLLTSVNATSRKSDER